MVSIDTAAAMRMLARDLLSASEALESGGALRESDPNGALLRGVAAYIGDESYTSAVQRSVQADDSIAAREHPLGSFLIDVLCTVRTWEGTVAELETLAADMDVPVRIDAALLHVRHWFARAIADVGVSVHLKDNGSIRLARHQWFSPPRAVKRSSEAQGARSSSPLLLGGYWLSRGIDPARCVYCLVAPFEEIEHFVPRSRGGSDDMSNLLPSCIACNRGRGDGKWTRDPWEWLRDKRPSRLAYFQELFNN